MVLVFDNVLLCESESRLFLYKRLTDFRNETKKTTGNKKKKERERKRRYSYRRHRCHELRGRHVGLYKLNENWLYAS